jgi:hypothetical protein
VEAAPSLTGRIAAAGRNITPSSPPEKAGIENRKWRLRHIFAAAIKWATASLRIKICMGDGCISIVEDEDEPTRQPKGACLFPVASRRGLC